MWSLGIMLYEMCTFQTPFQDQTIKSIVAKIVACKYKPLPERCGKHLSQIVTVLLDKEPEKRPSINNLLKLKVIKK
jgi:NIMA (never in mitosis gene a)-related kinase